MKIFCLVQRACFEVESIRSGDEKIRLSEPFSCQNGEKVLLNKTILNGSKLAKFSEFCDLQNELFSEEQCNFMQFRRFGRELTVQILRMPHGSSGSTISKTILMTPMTEHHTRSNTSYWC